MLYGIKLKTYKMIKQIIYFGILILTLGCNNETKEYSNNSKSENISSDDTIKESKNSIVYNPSYALWAYEFDESTSDFKIIKLRNANNDTLTPLGIENIINMTWPKVQIKFEEIKNDTIRISIPDSEVLTQQMGTSGADQFMISTTYSFTELKGINYVKFEFEIGDHASPGFYSRDYWNEY